MTDPLHLADRGEGPVVVLLHAFPCDSRMWLSQSDALVAAGHRVLVPDLPGFGYSPLLDDEPSLPAVADAVFGFLDAREIRRACVAGVSLGGYVAMAMARTRPELFSGIALCDTKATADTPAARENRERLAQLVEGAPEDTARILEQAVLPGLLGETSRVSRPAVVERVRTWLAAANGDTVAWYQRAMAARPDARDVLGGLQCASLVLWGSEDALSPAEEQALMIGALRDPTQAEISGAGHLANVEQPDVVSAALVEFAARL